MGKTLLLLLTLLLLAAAPAMAQQPFAVDVLETSGGKLRITSIGHSSLMLQYQGKVIHVDPVGKYADYSLLPKADIILLTHEHKDHLDPNALAAVRTPETRLLLTELCARQVAGGLVMRNGTNERLMGLIVEAVPAYNIVHLRDSGEPYHPRGSGNGYVITFGDTRVYVAGDTENTPEMKALTNITCAFLPMNIPFTMTPEMVADAALAFRPKILYPYHYGDTNPTRLVTLLQHEPAIEVRIRNLR